MSCIGSGKAVLKKDAWNIRRKNSAWKSSAYGVNEGWRTLCPDCGKTCAVGPSSHKIQKHFPAKPKAKRMTAAEKKIARLARLDLLYAEMYDNGVKGEGGLRPDTYPFPMERDEWPVFEMAYLDGLSDGGHTMKAGAFKRWLAKN